VFKRARAAIAKPFPALCTSQKNHTQASRMARGGYRGGLRSGRQCKSPAVYGSTTT
jgi:hypothetical protein